MGWLASVAALLLVMGGCTSDTDDGDGDGEGSTSPKPTSSESFSPSDRSSLVFDVELPKVQGSAQGSIASRPATVEVASVEATDTGTVLTYWFTGTWAETNVGPGVWTSMPQLVDPAGKQVYDPVLFTRADGRTYCVCTGILRVDERPQPRTVLYPVLPDGITEVQVRQPGFTPPITIPVTRD